MNNCLNKIVNDNFYIKNNIENPVFSGNSKINTKTYYSTSKKSYNNNRIKKIKCLSFSKNKSNSINNNKEQYSIE